MAVDCSASYALWCHERMEHLSGSSTMPANNATVRCTDVFQKDASGNWTIVNEHCSPVPKAT